MNRLVVSKRPLMAALAMFATGPALAADVGVAITIGQPGFYGRIELGDYPYPVPRLLYPRPVVVVHPEVVYDPIYLHVPPGHAKRWSYYCGRYHACDRPVYFVDSRWYRDEYVPRYREWHGDLRGEDMYHDSPGEGQYGRENRDHSHGHREDAHPGSFGHDKSRNRNR